MNKKQLNCMWVGIIILVAMALFPPWKAYQVSDDRRTLTVRKYSFIFKEPHAQERILQSIDKPEDYHWLSSVHLETETLVIQCFIVALVVCGLICTFKDKLGDEQKQ